MITVEESAIADAVALLARQEKVIAEGSGAVGVAALLTGSVRVVDPVVVVISGGNIDQDVLADLLQRDENRGVRREE